MVMEKVMVVEVLKSQEEVVYIFSQFFYSIGVFGDVKLEMVFLFGMMVYYVQSFFVVIQFLQYFVVLLNFVQNLFYVVSFFVVFQEVSFILQMLQVLQLLQIFMNGFVMQSLFIEEIYSVSVKNRVVFIEKVEKKWEEKR